MLKLLTFLFILTITLDSDIHASMSNIYKDSIIVKTPSGFVRIPKQKEKETLKGSGVTFRSSVKIEEKEIKDKDGKKILKKYTAYVRGCGDVELDSDEAENKNIKAGDSVELRFDKARSCNVYDWNKH